ncbi:hypothetical protein HYALB_00010415 [Hymenoscyphus albidus]|uniref:Uncharacterized protein n=1 Tax=Hymenoscyphus albidus TaxID=595503 RepID=A0A9N9Q8E2_9HELO|nr:hypothetical protein HYALB_00010415 [Hymenoscyphus albidus]
MGLGVPNTRNEDGQGGGRSNEGNNLQSGDNDDDKNPPYVPWEPSPTEAQILIYYRVVYALFMAYAIFWAKLLEMNAPLFRQYYPQLAPDRKPKVKLVWERLQQIITHVEPSDLPPDDRECMICQETFSERPRVAALQPWHTRLHDGFDSPLKLPCPHPINLLESAHYVGWVLALVEQKNLSRMAGKNM